MAFLGQGGPEKFRDPAFLAKYGMLKDSGYGEYAGLADRAYRRAYQSAWDKIGQAYGTELAGTPGFLAQSSLGPGGLARIRERTLRGGASTLASGMTDVAAQLEKEKLDFARKAIEEKRAKKKKKSLFSTVAGGVLGAGTGFLTGGPAGAIAGGVSGLGLPGGEAAGDAYNQYRAKKWVKSQPDWAGY